MTSETTLSGGLARHPGAAKWGPLGLGVLLGLLLGAAASELAIGRARGGASTPEPAAVERAWPVRELPREWRWAGPRYDFDRMFRRSRPAPRG